jgi:hypothetical protein
MLEPARWKPATLSSTPAAKANATNANLAGTANPVTVWLSIGNDTGVWIGNVPIN